ncbi:alpha/beta hydrolase [Sandarakinorhabdus sp. DWP1-3-1]|uniref:alpha/beta hydrolase n=1 Tax=Sandarakinorhabdus sp. DWP1-3-1 TaxID=2804627 RepID=UPI003CEAA4B0
MNKIVNGASLQPLSGGPPKQIVLLLHGYGSNGADLISLAPHWRPSLPDALFLAPDAPQRSGGGYQWWPLHGFTPAALAAGATQAAPAIEAFVDRKLAQYGLTDAELAIIGFSQGTMMALHVGLRRAAAPAAIVGYSGMLVGAHELAHADIVKPPVLLVHGSADPVVPVAALHAAKADLARLGIEAEAHVSTGLGHSVDPVGLRLGAAFVARGLGL